MTKLFVLDLDGCVSVPFQTPDWNSITRIRELNQLSRTDPTVPALSICTGRPYAYAEAVAQWLDIQHPIVFESGGGVYHPTEQRLEFASAYYQNKSLVERVNEWVEQLVEREYPGVLIEFTKKTDAGMVHSDEALIIELYHRAKEHIHAHHPEFEVHRTEVSVNIILKACSKGFGLKWLSVLTDISVQDMAYIGDSSGDISALKVAGKSYTPANGSPALDQYAKRLEGHTSLGVLEAYLEIIDQNRA
jgi:HAD superfamily hydrolase (TIGR01484 family)